VRWLPFRTRPETRKQGGHGEHWAAVAGEGYVDRVMRWIAATVSHPAQVQGREPLVAHYSGDPSLRVCALLRRTEVVSAFPAIEGGQRLPMVVEEVVEWASGVEAQVVGNCRGLPLAFFDTRYPLRRSRYRRGQMQTCFVNGLAYRIEPAQATYTAGEEGELFRLAGQHRCEPLEGGDIDDFVVHSPLERLRESTFQHQPIWILTVTLALTEDLPVQINCVACEPAFEGWQELPEVGDDLRVSLWLQGGLADD